MVVKFYPETIENLMLVNNDYSFPTTLRKTGTGKAKLITSLLLHFLP